MLLNLVINEDTIRILSHKTPILLNYVNNYSEKYLIPFLDVLQMAVGFLTMHGKTENECILLLHKNAITHHNAEWKDLNELLKFNFNCEENK